MDKLYPTENPDSILREIRGFADPALQGRNGRVLSVTGNIAHVEGMPEAGFMEEVQFSSGARGLVWQLLRRSVSVLLISDPATVEPGTTAVSTGSQVRVPVGRELLGRVVNHLGEPIDGGVPLACIVERELGASLPPITLVRKPFQRIQTGNAKIDFYSPLARGSSQLIIGDKNSGKTKLVQSIITQQCQRNETTIDQERTLCVYVAIGQPTARIEAFARTLQAQGAMEYSVIVAAGASTPTGGQILAPTTAETIASWFRDQGCHAMLFLDDLSAYAVAYREMAFELGLTLTRRRYPPEVLHRVGQIVEGACQIKRECGGGSLTILAVAETGLEDLSDAPVHSFLTIIENHWILRSMHSEFEKRLDPDFFGGYTRKIEQWNRNEGNALNSIMMSRFYFRTFSLRERVALEYQIISPTEVDNWAWQRFATERAMLACLADPLFENLTMGEQAVILYSGIVGFYLHIDTRSKRDTLATQVWRMNPSLRDKVIRDHGLTNESAWCLNALLKSANDAGLI